MIKSLYFSCYYAYLLGNLPQTQMYYSFLKDELKVSNPQVLKLHQLLELKKIREALSTGCISKNKWLSDQNGTGPQNLETAKIRQPELIQKIHQDGCDKLKEILQDDVYLYNIEHPCGNHGNADMVYMGKDTVYPVEVKKDQGKHDLIGQINKYALYHKLRLHHGHYAFVRPITICHSYNPYVLSELKQYDILPLYYVIISDKLSLNIS